MSNSTKLLPCPFCSNADISIKNESPKDNSGGYFIECPGCGASTALRFACGDDPTPILTEAWNRRTTSHCLHQIQEPAPVQAAVDAPVAAMASPTFMTADQARDWAWNKVREDVGTEGWTVMDSVNYYGFFLWGWNYRGKYELQRTATRSAVMQEILSAAPAAAAPVVLPEPDAGIKEVMGLIADLEREAADVGYGHGSQRLVNEKRATIESKLRALLATATGLPAQAVLDYPWRDRLLDGRELVRDQQGFAEHPELPLLDEGTKPRAFFAALGVEMKHTMAEDDLSMDEYDAMNDAVNWSAWTPRPPIGEAWNLVAIFDTEDGPAAWWARAQKESREAAPQAQADARDAQWLQAVDMAALERFDETTDDDQSYDIGKDAVTRLARFGCLQNLGFGQYSITAFGNYVLNNWSLARELPFKMQSERDAEHRAAIAAAKGESQ